VELFYASQVTTLHRHAFDPSNMMQHQHNHESFMRTGAEAMFADLGHFSKKGIQVIFHQNCNLEVLSL